MEIQRSKSREIEFPEQTVKKREASTSDYIRVIIVRRVALAEAHKCILSRLKALRLAAVIRTSHGIRRKDW